MRREDIMSRASWVPDGVGVTEKYLKMSDGTELKVTDFLPEGDAPEKPVIVFVAGWISLISGWIDVLTELIPEYQTLYVETREKISARLPGIKGVDFSIERMSRDLDEVLAQILPKDKAFYFVGSSLGSTVILEYLSANKKQPRDSFIISPIPEFAIPAWGLLVIRFLHPGFYLVIKPVIKWYLRNFRLDKDKEPEQVAKYEGTLDAAEPGRLKANARAIKDYSLWGKLHEIKSPVLIIGAKTDTLHGVEILEKMVSMMPSARMAQLESNKETHSQKAGALMIGEIDRRQQKADG